MKMKTMTMTAIIIVLMYGSMLSFGQNISVTFSGNGAATQIDSVTATNLGTNQSVTLPGNETLILAANSGIPTNPQLADVAIVYPNPFSGTAELSVSINKPQTVYVRINNLFGQMVAQTKDFVRPGENQFALTVNSGGVYMISITSEQGTISFKVICTEATDTENQIHYLGIGSHNPQPSEYKSLQTGYTLGYTSGEIILYKCYSGIYTTVVTDSPADAKNYEVNFVECIDPAGRSYPIVRIGTLDWMAENLAYLPSVNKPSSESRSSNKYYVYGYDGVNIDDARNHPNYSTYGVLYNWPAAKSSCPTGWYLPTKSEWMILRDLLGDSAGGKMKETGQYLWASPDIGATNQSGFTGLPGGDRQDDTFVWLSTSGGFWSDTQIDLTFAWGLGLSCLSEKAFINQFFRAYGNSVRCVKGYGYPSVATADFLKIMKDSAIGGGEVLNDGGFDITERGTCWNLEGLPTLEDNKTINGSGIGVFSSSISGLQAETKYYVRAYAINSMGVSYGEQKLLMTASKGDDGSFEYLGRTYHYKKIGTQTWMTENLAYLPSVSPSSANSNTDPHYYVYGYEGNTVVEAQATPNYEKYGVLYNWSAARNACPTGWHCPSYEEWTDLTDYLTSNGYGHGGSGDDIGKSMASKSGWVSSTVASTIGNDPESNNRSGFDAKPAGYKNYGSYGFEGLSNQTSFWSDTEINSIFVHDLFFAASNSVIVVRGTDKTSGYSVRCVKDN